MPNLNGTPPVEPRQRRKRTLAASLLVPCMLMAATFVGAYGLALHMDGICGESRCEALVGSPKHGAFEAPLRDTHNPSPGILPPTAGPTVTCIQHSKDLSGCTPATLDLRQEEALASGIDFLFHVDQEDNATTVLEPLGLDTLSTPELDLLNDGTVRVSPSRDSVEVRVEVYYPTDESTQIFDLDPSIDSSIDSSGLPVEHRGTGDHAWTFAEEHLVEPKLTGQYVVTFVAEGAGGIAKSAPTAITVVGEAPPQLQAVGSLPVLTEGMSATYRVELQGSPGQDKAVVWDLTSSSPRVTVLPPRVTLSTAGEPVEITVSAPDDEIARGDESVTISHVFNMGLSTWKAWPLDPFTASINLVDDDKAGFDVQVLNNTVREGGDANIVSISLTSEPLGEVRVEADLGAIPGTSVSPRHLHFGPDNWTEHQETLVRFAPDGTPGNIRAYHLTVRATHPSSTQPLTSDYLHAPSVDVPITVIDDDSVLLRVFQGTLLHVPEHMEGSQVRISPMIRPEGTVIVNIQSSDSTAVVPTPSRLTFTPLNWSMHQSVFLGVVPDNAGAGDRSVIVSFAVDDKSAPTYRSTKTLAVTVKVGDNDPPGANTPSGSAQPPPVVLAAPSGLTADLLGQQVSLTWRAAPGQATPAFAIWRYPAGHVVDIVPATALATQSYEELMPDSIHRYAVQAVTGTSNPQFNPHLATKWVVVMRPEALETTCKPDMLDTDGDGLCDLFETIVMTSPTNPDTDGDGVSDYDEIMTAKSNPLDPRSFPVHDAAVTSEMAESRAYTLAGAAAIVLIAAVLLTVVLGRRRAGAKEADPAGTPAATR